MAVVSRLEINHPALGTAGGAALYTQIEDIYKKIGDNMADRFFMVEGLLNGASVDVDHNFFTDFANLRYDLYLLVSSVTKEIGTRITKSSTPAITAFTIAAKVGSEKTHITITNSSGVSRDLVLVVFDDPIELDELVDVDFSTPPEDGQAMVFEQSSNSWKPGASGDSSFKFQKLTGTVLTIKKGYLVLSSGEEIYSSVDLTPDLATFIAGANDNYYGYFDKLLFPAATTVSGRKLIAMTTAQLVFLTTTPDNINLSRYIPIGKVVKSGGVFSSIETLAMRRHDVALGADASLEYTLPLQAISSVGTASQIAAGHVLTQNSFPSAAYAATSFYNLLNANDINTGLAHNLTNNGTVPFTGTGILGLANSCATFNGSSQYLSSTDIHFDPGDTDFTAGCWINPTSWTTGTLPVITQYNTTNNVRSFYIALIGGVLNVICSTTGTDEQIFTPYNASGLTGWHHLAFKYVASSNSWSLYLDGRIVGSGVLTTNLYTAGANRRFNLGSSNNGSGFYSGKIDEFFFCNGTAFSDNDIAKIYASKLTHSRTLSPISQKWVFTGVSAGGQARELLDVVVDMDADDLYFDLSDELSTTQAELKLYNISSMGSSKAAKPRTLEMTVDALDALLPITHGLGVVPEISFKVKNLSNDYEYHDAGSLFVATATQIKLAGDTLTTTYGTGVVVVLTYATASIAQFVPNQFWKNVVASSAVALLPNDRVFANTVAAAFTGTLPLTPSVGDEIQVCDAKGNFGVNAFTFGRNGQSINGIAADFDCNISGKMWRAVYVDATYGWAIYY